MRRVTPLGHPESAQVSSLRAYLQPLGPSVVISLQLLGLLLCFVPGVDEVVDLRLELQGCSTEPDLGQLRVGALERSHTLADSRAVDGPLAHPVRVAHLAITSPRM